MARKQVGTAPPNSLGREFGIDYTVAVALGSRPSWLPPGSFVRIWGGATTDPAPPWMIPGDYRDCETV